MSLNTAKAPTARNGGALGNVFHSQAIDTRDYTHLPLAQQQSAWLERRFCLAPAHAATVAALAFGREERTWR